MKNNKYCKICNQRFYKSATCGSKEWNEQRKYCSVKCANKAHSKRMMGKKLTYNISGKNNPNFKYSISKKFLIKEYIINKKTKQQISDIIGCCIRPIVKYMKKYNIPTRNHSERHRGKLCATYNPNLTELERINERNYFDYRLWRTKVYERDDYTCQKCNCRNGDGKKHELNAHHIESYRTNPKLRTKLSNGITLCKDCHYDFHHQFGYGNNINEQIEIFLRR